MSENDLVGLLGGGIGSSLVEVLSVLTSEGHITGSVLLGSFIVPAMEAILKSSSDRSIALRSTLELLSSLIGASSPATMDRGPTESSSTNLFAKHRASSRNATLYTLPNLPLLGRLIALLHVQQALTPALPKESLDIISRLLEGLCGSSAFRTIVAKDPQRLASAMLESSFAKEAGDRPSYCSQILVGLLSCLKHGKTGEHTTLSFLEPVLIKSVPRRCSSESRLARRLGRLSFKPHDLATSNLESRSTGLSPSAGPRSIALGVKEARSAAQSFPTFPRSCLFERWGDLSRRTSGAMLSWESVRRGQSLFSFREELALIRCSTTVGQRRIHSIGRRDRWTVCYRLARTLRQFPRRRALHRPTSQHSPPIRKRIKSIGTTRTAAHRCSRLDSSNAGGGRSLQDEATRRSDFGNCECRGYCAQVCGE